MLFNLVFYFETHCPNNNGSNRFESMGSVWSCLEENMEDITDEVSCAEVNVGHGSETRPGPIHWDWHPHLSSLYMWSTLKKRCRRRAYVSSELAEVEIVWKEEI